MRADIGGTDGVRGSGGGCELVPPAAGKGATDPRAAGGGTKDPRASDDGGGGTKDPRGPAGTGGGKLGARPEATGGLERFELTAGLTPSPAGEGRIPLSEGITPGFGVVPLDAGSLITSPPFGYLAVTRRHCF